MYIYTHMYTCTQNVYVNSTVRGRICVYLHVYLCVLVSDGEGWGPPHDMSALRVTFQQLRFPRSQFTILKAKRIQKKNVKNKKTKKTGTALSFLLKNVCFFCFIVGMPHTLIEGKRTALHR